MISISSFDFAYYQVSYLVQNSVQTTLSYVIWKHKSCFLLVTYSLVDRPQGSCALKYEKALQNYSFDLLLSLTCLPKKQPDSLSPKGLLRYINTHMYNPQSTTLSDQGRGDVQKVTFKNSLRRLIYFNSSRLIFIDKKSLSGFPSPLMQTNRFFMN